MTSRTLNEGIRISNARKAFGAAGGEFHSIEGQFLNVVNDLLDSNDGRVRNLALLEGLRSQLLMSFETRYRAAVNELADAVIDWLDDHAKSHVSNA